MENKKQKIEFRVVNLTTLFYFHSIFSFHFISLKKRENTMIILRNPQIAKLIEAGCALNSNVIIGKNDTKK